MANFPRLTTGAVTQYPSSRNMTYSTHVLRFVDGREQRFREVGGPVRSWVVSSISYLPRRWAQLKRSLENVRGSSDLSRSWTHGTGRSIRTAASISRSSPQRPWTKDTTKGS